MMTNDPSQKTSKGKVKCTLVQALRLSTSRTAHRGSTGIALLFYHHSTRSSEGSASRPGHFLPPGKNRYPLYRRLAGPHGRFGQVWKISPPPGFDPRAVQPVASRYTDWATRPPNRQVIRLNHLSPELNPICYLLALLAHDFLHVSRIRVKSLNLRLLMSIYIIYIIYIYIYIWSTYSWCF
jgi:hypothetical protein